MNQLWFQFALLFLLAIISLENMYLKSNSSRIMLIDSIRGLSVLMVVFGHYGNPDFFKIIFGNIFANPYYAVVIFFVASGFLITSGLVGNDFAEIKLKTFYLKRISKIVPSLFFVVVCLIALGGIGVDGFVFPATVSYWDAALSVFSFRANYFYLKFNLPGVQAWSPLWSLSLEEVFYIIFPLIFFLLRRMIYVVLFLMTMIIISIFYRNSDYGFLYLWQGCFGFLSTGCLFAILSWHLTKINYRFIYYILYIYILVFVISLFVMLQVIDYEHVNSNYKWGTFIVSICGGFCMLSAAQLNNNSKIYDILKLSLAPLSVIGIHSYEIYLFHMPVHIYFNAFQYLPLVNFLIVLLFSLFFKRYFSDPAEQYIRSRFIKDIAK